MLDVAAVATSKTVAPVAAEARSSNGGSEDVGCLGGTSTQTGTVGTSVASAVGSTVASSVGSTVAPTVASTVASSIASVASVSGGNHEDWSIDAG